MRSSRAQKAYDRLCDQLMYTGAPTDQRWHCLMSAIENADQMVHDGQVEDCSVEWYQAALGGYELNLDSGHLAEDEAERQEKLAKRELIATIDLGTWTTPKCACGCGQWVRQTFRPGHDARVKPLIVRAGKAKGVIKLIEPRGERLVTADQFAYLVLSAPAATAVVARYWF
jgi:hypothetical protein